MYKKGMHLYVICCLLYIQENIIDLFEYKLIMEGVTELQSIEEFIFENRSDNWECVVEENSKNKGKNNALKWEVYKNKELL